MHCTLMKKCQKYDVITFDVFDTLLKRDVMSPTDVFCLIEQEFDQKHGIKSGFAEKRIYTEYTLRKANSLREVTLDEIYEAIDYSKAQRQELKTLELATEKGLLHANYPLKYVFDYCIAQKKKVFLISDMYLPVSFLKEILKDAGFAGYQKFYLSCEYRKTKLTGELFRVFLQEERIKRDNVLHIGDSICADVLGSFRAGIKCFHIPKNPHNTLYMPLPEDSSALSKRCLYAFINSRECRCTIRSEQLGYELLGPLIYGYCVQLHNHPKRKGRKVWLSARDMYLFEKAYKLLYPEDDFEYIYLSRKSLRPIYADAVGNLAKSGEAFPDKEYTLSQVIGYMGYELEDANISELCNLEGKKYQGRSLGDYPEVRKALDSPIIVKKEAELAAVGKQYLDKHGLFSEPLLLADIGWHGTTQLLLEKIREKSSQMPPIIGYYLGCCQGTSKRIGKDTYGTWLFDEEDNRPFMRGIVLLESMILAPHGSTVRFEKEGSSVVPIFAEPENIPNTILEMQQGAMSFITDFKKSLLSNAITVHAETVCAGFEKLEMTPKNEELEYIGELDYENFYQTKIASPKKFRYYLIHWKALKDDFMYAGWRTGFMYRLFKLRLPYGKIYDLGRWGWKKIKKKDIKKYDSEKLEV